MSSVNFRVIPRITEFAEQYYVASEFIKRLHERFKEESIEIPFPIRTLVEPSAAYLNGAAAAKPAPRTRKRAPAKAKVEAE